MKMKLSKQQFADITKVTDQHICISDGQWQQLYLSAGKHTRADFTAVNVSTADIECLVQKYGDAGIRIAGRDRQFRLYRDPMWRE